MWQIPFYPLSKEVCTLKSFFNNTLHRFLLGFGMIAGITVSSATVQAEEVLLHPSLPSISVYEAAPSAQDEPSLLDSSLHGAASVSDRYYNAASEGLVTTAKDQNPYGTCWAFSAISACESSMIRRGLYNNTLDLSELHFSYFFFHTQNDPLGGTKNDANVFSGANYLNAGGTDACTMFALAKWTGAADEALAPYPDGSALSAPDVSLAYQDLGHLQNVRYVSGSDRESIKKLILQYGAVSAPLYADFSKYYSASTYAYCCKKSLVANHQVTLVGWDDDYSINNFPAGSRPSQSGAWIAKNSYGSSFGDQGFFYISYEDASLTYQKKTNNDSQSLVFAYDMESSSNYSHNYQYDGSASCTYMTLPSGCSMANIFTVGGNPGSQERLDAVSFALASPNVQYAIQIYKNPPSGNPSGGIAVFDQAQTGVTTYCGYYTIPLDQKVIFRQGDRYAVVISFSSPTSSQVSCFVDNSSTLDTIRFQSRADLGESYYRTSANGWIDIGYQDMNCRIKAFTTDTNEPATAVLPNISGLGRPAFQSLKLRSSTSLRLTWEEVTYADGYQIYRRTSNGRYTLIHQTASTSYLDIQTVPGKKYSYRIVAFANSRYHGTIYSPVSVTRSKKIQPPKVQIRTVKKRSSTKAVLTWKKIPGVSGYEISCKTSGKKWKTVKTIKRAGITKATVSHSGSKRGTYRIRAYLKSGKKKVYGAYSDRKKL